MVWCAVKELRTFSVKDNSSVFMRDHLLPHFWGFNSMCTPGMASVTSLPSWKYLLSSSHTPPGREKRKEEIGPMGRQEERKRGHTLVDNIG